MTFLHTVLEKALIAALVAVALISFISIYRGPASTPAISGTPGPVPSTAKLTGTCCAWQETRNKMAWCWPTRSDGKCYSADIPPAAHQSRQGE